MSVHLQQAERKRGREKERERELNVRIYIRIDRDRDGVKGRVRASLINMYRERHGEIVCQEESVSETEGKRERERNVVERERRKLT